MTVRNIVACVFLNRLLQFLQGGGINGFQLSDQGMNAAGITTFAFVLQRFANIAHLHRAEADARAFESVCGFAEFDKVASVCVLANVCQHRWGSVAKHLDETR